ncbi:hypothetical protein [Nocardioides okcheonensis]|uniref:hypothetical protein n=1 Tax=Nocardioides okcheonensis TaxID=2894081 RepID=UPI001E3F7486|nr:hypothetical protein [Nocardioides okcheonensis]UFN44305.1 hypothetical protein LN652_20025 [Nocardioides okcheonensis]
MTTESQHHPRTGAQPLPGAWGMRVVGRSAGLTAAVGALVVLAAALVHGAEPAAAAAVGAAMVVAVVSFGTVALHLVASVMPRASLLVALVTYLTQLAVVMLVFLAISRGDVFADEQARGWLAASMVLATLVWTTAHLVLTARARTPYFDLPPGGES